MRNSKQKYKDKHQPEHPIRSYGSDHRFGGHACWVGHFFAQVGYYVVGHYGEPGLREAYYEGEEIVWPACACAGGSWTDGM